MTHNGALPPDTALEPIAARHANAIAEMLAEIAAAGERHAAYALRLGTWWDDIPSYVAFWQRLAAGPDPARGLVRCETLVLVRGVRVLGELRVRFALTDALRRDGGNVGYAVRPSERRRGLATALLRAGLARLHAAGVAEALVTVSVSNVASLRVVAACGGVALDEVALRDGDTNRRFHVATAAHVPGPSPRPSP